MYSNPPPSQCTRTGDGPLVFGHRGARGHAPENTLLGIETGIRLGADWIEVDVHLNAGNPVLMHDLTLDRTTNGRGFVADVPPDYLAELDAGRGQKVPSVLDAIDMIDRRAGLNLELKAAGSAAVVVREIRHAVQLLGWDWSAFLVSSFDLQELRQLRALEPRIPIGALYAGVPLDYAASAEALGAVSVHLSHEFLAPNMIRDARARGLAVHVYTVNDPVEIARVRALGVDGIFTDYPERVLVLDRVA
ncbi:MAG: hypothetical protein KAG72_04350 [Abyssibacter sp.]|nr:glycerophosphodiester phosphodiesterase family protein [Abyssibacter sp.]MBB88009.1 glycerophosphodiester phosphodiesterase [Xanthomonadales bacterium]MCK5858558.1 hypothetical protein [Abyssibacter sp.]